ncbi:MAG: hypothetical protein ACKV0T_18250, partial [Planctomycetales bacterium]
TAPVDREKLAMFRKHKDPAILHAKFQPLWERCRFLKEVERLELREINVARNDLAIFIRALRMGDYYAFRIGNLLEDGVPATMGLQGHNDNEHAASMRDYEATFNYQQKLVSNRESILGLIVELLRYQDWLPENHDRRPV